MSLLLLLLLSLVGCPEPARTPPGAPPAQASQSGAGRTYTRITIRSGGGEPEDLAKVMERIGQQVGRTIVVDPKVQESIDVSLQDLPWREAVDVIAKMTRCEVEEREDGVILLTQAPRVTIQGAMSAKDLLEEFAGLANRGVTLPAGFPVEQSVTLHGEFGWREGFERVLSECGDYEVEDWGGISLVVVVD